MAQKDRVYYRLRTHLEMLRDRVRCLAYQKALVSAVRDKVVLDVGCGSGILSFFAARAGAKQVLAVDTDIPAGAEEAARINGLADRVQFFPGKIQDVKLPVDSVDIIVSEWMGGILLMEDMLPAVLLARDRWLKPGGLLLPDRGRLFLAPLDDVAGISSRHFPGLRDTISSQMWVSIIDPSQFLAPPACILDLDLYRVQETAAKSYNAKFHFTLKGNGLLNGFGLWFDVVFSHAEPPELLSTAPWLPPTHWSQALWILPVDIGTSPGDIVSGTFSQTKIVPSRASFKADVRVRGAGQPGGKISFSQPIEANPSNMNTPGDSENRLLESARADAYQGHDCLWIGCSMSFGALEAAINGARQVSILNHSPWAARAMKQLAAQEGLTNVRFISEVHENNHMLFQGVQSDGKGSVKESFGDSGPETRLLLSRGKGYFNPAPRSSSLIDHPSSFQDAPPAHREFILLGAADSSWQALLSHIKARRLLGQASFLLRFFRQESPWTQFYGFDFSAYAPYDLEMYHEDKTFTDGMVLTDIPPPKSKSPGKEIIYRGRVTAPPHASLKLADGTYYGVKACFHCGTVVLPLPGGLKVDSAGGKSLQKAGLTISVLNAAICRFRIILSGPGWLLRQDYEQPLSSLGHIALP